MEKLKKARVRVHICPTCKGNGYVKVASLDKDESTVHQCWDCDSEGEIYVDESEVVESYIDADYPTDNARKLH